MKTPPGWFDPDGHLNEEACALWVDALSENTVATLPEPVARHGEECLACKKKILTVQRLLNDKEEVTESATFSMQFQFQTVYRRNALLAAALVVILLGIGISVLYIGKQKHKNNESLFSEYFIPYPDILTLKSNQGPPSHDSLFQAGLIAYSAANYDTAISIFMKLNALNPEDDTLGFYLANSLLASGEDPGKAIHLLESVVGSNGPFAGPAQWYLALAWIRMNKNTEAADLLKKIADEPNLYQGKATELLKAID